MNKDNFIMNNRNESIKIHCPLDINFVTRERTGMAGLYHSWKKKMFQRFDLYIYAVYFVVKIFLHILIFLHLVCVCVYVCVTFCL